MKNATSVGRVQTFDKSRLYAGFILPPKAKWPRLTKTEKTTIAAFLNHYLTDAEIAIAATQRQMAIVPDHPGLAEQLTYWKNVIGGIRWMISRIDDRQKYLAIDHPETVKSGE